MIQLSSNKKSQSWKLDFGDELKKFQAQKKLIIKFHFLITIPITKKKRYLKSNVESILNANV